MRTDKRKPTKKQQEFLSWQMGVFFHFGIRTFNEGHKDWDGKPMALSTFNPKALDCGQWIRTIREGGAKYAVLTAKHHDGFANWPSAYTEYSVKNTPWKDGKGDVVREYVDACREYGVKAGLYYSPAQFGSRAMQGKEYDDYFINQITELLTNYGKIDYLWFDGCGSEGHEYDRNRIVGIIRSLQPDILIFSMWDPDTRWVGNEEGIVPLGCTNVVSAAKTSINVQEAQWLGEDKFLPYECDCKIRRHNWFYSDSDGQYLRSLEDLMGLYDLSVGRGGNLLLNIGPDRDGLLPKEDAARYIEFGNAVKKQFANLQKATIIREGNIFTLCVKEPANISTVVLKENLEEGESVREFRISYHFGTDMPLYEGKAIGAMQICRFPSVYLDENRLLKIEITKADGDFDISGIQLF